MDPALVSMAGGGVLHTCVYKRRRGGGGQHGGADTRRGFQVWSHTSFSSQALLCGVILLLLTACQARKHPGGTQAHHHHHVPCFSQEQLQAGEVPMHYVSRAVHWDRYAPVQMVPYLEQAQRDRSRRRRRHPEPGCPTLQLAAGAHSEANERSISPWRYR